MRPDLLTRDLSGALASDLSDPATIFHVTLSLGDDAMIEAPQTGDIVKIEQGVSANSYWAPKFIGGLRLDS